MRNRTSDLRFPRSDALPLIHNDSTVSEVYYHLFLYFFTEHKTFHLSYSIYKHDAIDIADPSSMQDAYHMNFVIDLANCRVSEVDIFFAYFSCLSSRSFSKLCLSFFLAQICYPLVENFKKFWCFYFSQILWFI